MSTGCETKMDEANQLASTTLHGSPCMPDGPRRNLFQARLIFWLMPLLAWFFVTGCGEPVNGVSLAVQSRALGTQDLLVCRRTNSSFKQFCLVDETPMRVTAGANNTVTR